MQLNLYVIYCQPIKNEGGNKIIKNRKVGNSNMAKIIPYRGVLYNQAQIEDMCLVVAQTYDVIYGEGQENYYKNHENNNVRRHLCKNL